MKNGFWLILKNSLGCELDRSFVVTAKDSLPPQRMFATVDWCLNDGDTIRIERGTSRP